MVCPIRLKNLENIKIMNIFGIGTDIVSVNRIKNSIKNKNFINQFSMKRNFKM